jgi:hypothetical protein
MEKTYKMCQSCSMPMKQDPNGGGSNADGSKSVKYCSHCWERGAFKWDCTAKQMQDFCKGKLKEMGYSSLKAWFFTMGIPRLERWKK